MNTNEAFYLPSLGRFNSSAILLSVKIREIVNLLTQDPRVKFRTRSRLAASAASITAFSPIFTRVHTEAVMASLRSSAIALQISTLQPSEPIEPIINEQQFLKWAEEQKKLLEQYEKATGKAWHEAVRESCEIITIPFASLHACYQSFFYLVRAFQDVIYCILLELHGKNSGQYSSMVDAPKNEVGTFLENNLPQYIPWFISFRDMRNKLKMGIPTDTCGPDTDLGIIINYFNEDSSGVICDVKRGFRLGDAAEAIDKTISVLNALKVLVKLTDNV